MQLDSFGRPLDCYWGARDELIRNALQSASRVMLQNILSYLGRERPRDTSRFSFPAVPLFAGASSISTRPVQPRHKLVQQ